MWAGWSVGALSVAAVSWLIISYVGNENSGRNAGRPDCGEKVTVAIAVLSARENQEQRQAIRQTWMRFLTVTGNCTRAVVKFVVGNASCPWHPADRASIYSCEPWTVLSDAAVRTYPAVVSVTKNVSGETDGRRTISSTKTHESWPLAMELDKGCYLAFRVMHDVLLVTVGVRRSLLRGWIEAIRSVSPLEEQPLAVDVVDATTEMLVGSADFWTVDLERSFRPSSDLTVHGGYGDADSDSSEGDNACEFVYKTVQVILKKGFTGIIRCVNCRQLDGAGRCSTTYDGSGLIQFVVPTYFRSHSACDGAVSFEVSAADRARLAEHVAGRPARQSGWASHALKVARQLSDEAQQYGDLVFVDTVDVYRHLADKLLKGIKWFVANQPFDYVMKTDDDCYVDVDGVVERLHHLRSEHGEDRFFHSGVWLGNFRRDWAVQRHGKWAEEAYVGISYPDFACGAGYVISDRLASWLASNEASLWRFQGEDVSLGIWLSALQPLLVQDDNIHCSSDCSASALAVADRSVSDLYDLWSRKQRTGQPC